MKATFHRVQVSDGTSYLSGSFRGKEFEVVGVIHPKRYPGIKGVTQATAHVYALAKEFLEGALWISYIYRLGDLSTGFGIGQAHPDDTVVFISAGDGLLAAGKKVSERFKTHLEHNPYCDEVSWTKEGLRVQLADIALPYDRAVIHEILLSLYGQ